MPVEVAWINALKLSRERERVSNLESRVHRDSLEGRHPANNASTVTRNLKQHNRGEREGGREGGREDGRKRAAARTGQIGRASCRERV